MLAVIGGPALAGVLIPFRDGSSPSYETLLFLALAVACALVGGRWPAIAASVVGFVLLNYFFTAPLHSLTTASTENILTITIFVVTSIAVSSVVDSAARRRHQSIRARAEADTLGMLNRTVLGGNYDVPKLLDLVRDTFAAEGAELVSGMDVRPGDTASAATKGTVLVLRGRSLAPSEHRILDAFARHVGVLRERADLARQTQAARELEAGNRTRTALLAAVSHDLRTPLTSIKTAAETLRTADARLSSMDRAELLKAVEDSTDRLSTIVTDLLDMSRLQMGAVQPALEIVSLSRIVLEALRGVQVKGKVDVDPDLPDVVADPGLLERVVENLVTNAVQHSERVRITALSNGSRVQLRIEDHGPGVPDPFKARMFEPFQRLGDVPKGTGVGLGLAVARGLTEAQRGDLHAEDTPGGGLTMIIDLPAANQ
jgi:two-component system sensor histidine kinase KdpD